LPWNKQTGRTADTLTSIYNIDVKMRADLFPRPFKGVVHKNIDRFSKKLISDKQLMHLGGFGGRLTTFRTREHLYLYLSLVLTSK
jgi:hypothetical protein